MSDLGEPTTPSDGKRRRVDLGPFVKKEPEGEAALVFGRLKLAGEKCHR